jgi:PAS domain S-box-containing protein
VDANQAAVNFYGYPLEQLRGMPITRINTLPAPDIRKAITRKSQSGQPYFAFRHRLASGEVRDVEVYSSQVETSRQSFYFSVVNDMTERQRAERALRESERQYRELYEHLLDGWVRTDLEGHFLECNSAYEKMLGYTLEELKSLKFPELTPPRWYEFEKKVVKEQIIGRGYSDLYEKEYIRKDGTVFPIEMRAYLVRDSVGRPQGMWGLVRDITLRKRVQREMRRSERKYRTLFENSAEALFVMTDVFLDCNESAMKLFRCKKEDLIGHTPLDISPEIQPDGQETADVAAEHMFAAMKGEEQFFYWQHKRPDGSLFDAEVLLISIEMDDQHTLLASVRDVTEKRKQEEERRRFEAKVQETQKLESLGVLAGGIAHDFNNLLMGILGNADLALNEMSPVAPARTNLQQIERAARRAADLCKQMLAYSGRGRFMIEPINLSELVEEMAHMLQVSVSKKAVLKYNFAASLPLFEGDATQVRQVVMNLITNASDALEERSGVISISTGFMDCDENYLNDNSLSMELPEGRYVYMEVSDSGSGMDEQTRRRIFEPFFTTKFTGRGLGLAAVLGIVRGHKGAIKVYSEPGRGTTFKVLFPACAQPAAAPVIEAPPAEMEATGPVLVIDDEEWVRDVAGEMLDRLGFKSLFSSDGQQGIDLFRRHEDEICCVILDLTMQGLDGEQTFRELRRIKSDVRVIISSGYSEQEVIDRFSGKGLAGFLQKPYRLEDLQEKLSAALGDRVSQDS